MPDGIVISIQTDDAGVRRLVDAMTNANTTVKEMGAIQRQVRGDLIAGSQAQRDYNAVMSQYNNQMRVPGGLLDNVRQMRSEHRLMAFGLMSAMGAMDGLVGKNKELTETLQGSLNAGLGFKFMLDAIGAKMLSLPVAIGVGAFVALKSAFDDVDKAVNQIRADEEKELELNLKLGLITHEQMIQTLKDQKAAIENQITQLNLDVRSAEIMTGKWGVLAAFIGQTPEQVIAKIHDAMVQEKEIDVKIAEQQKAITDEAAKQQKAQEKNAEAAEKTAEAAERELAARIHLTALMTGKGTLGMISPQTGFGSYAEWFEKAYPDIQKTANETSVAMDKAVNGLKQYADVELPDAINQQDEFGDAVKVSFQEIAQDSTGNLLNGLVAIEQHTLKAGQAFKQMGQMAIAEIEAIATKLALLFAIEAIANAIVPGSGTGVAAFLGLIGKQHGGWAEAGVPIAVGEAGTEIFIPSRSGNIVPNYATTQINNYSSVASHGSISPDVHVSLLIDRQGLSALVVSGQQVRNHRLM